MRGGDLDQRVTLQNFLESRDGGEYIKTYSDYRTVSAKVISQKGEESFTSARTDAKETIRVKMRHLKQITVDWRLMWFDQIYDIKYVDRSNRRKGELWLTCEIHGAR